MNVLVCPSGVAGRRWRGSSGLTLAELMVAMGVFSFAVIAMVYVQMFAMQEDELVNSKSGACEMARMSFNDLANDIRAAKIWQIGNGNLTSFTAIANGTAQQGTALKLSMGTNTMSAVTNSYVIYYFDTNNAVLCRAHSGDANSIIIARYLTNTMYFAAETPQGTNQTSVSYKGVIHVVMQFCQYQFPITKIGPGYYYNYYRMDLRVTPHVPDGS